MNPNRTFFISTPLIVWNRNRVRRTLVYAVGRQIADSLSTYRTLVKLVSVVHASSAFAPAFVGVRIDFVVLARAPGFEIASLGEHPTVSARADSRGSPTSCRRGRRSRTRSCR